MLLLNDYPQHDSCPLCRRQLLATDSSAPRQEAQQPETDPEVEEMVRGLMAAMEQARTAQHRAHGGSFHPREDTYERDESSFSGMYS